MPPLTRVQAAAKRDQEATKKRKLESDDDTEEAGDSKRPRPANPISAAIAAAPGLPLQWRPTLGGLRLPPQDPRDPVTGSPYTVDISRESSATGEEPNIIVAETIVALTQAGARFQSWIEDPAVAGCPVQPATLTFQEMFSYPPQPAGEDIKDGDTTAWAWHSAEFSWTYAKDSVEDDAETVGFFYDQADWNHLLVRQTGWSAPVQEFRTSEYVHYVKEGGIIASLIVRQHGPHWSEVALAHYNQVCKSPDSLRFVWVCDIVNTMTADYVKALYRDNGIKVKMADKAECIWQYGAPEYQALLGTPIGKGVASLVLGAWPRGTRRITQIKTYFYEKEIQIRFDIGQSPEA